MKRFRKKKSKDYLFESWAVKPNTGSREFPRDYYFLGRTIVPVSKNTMLAVHNYLRKKFPKHNRLEPINKRAIKWWASLASV